MTSWGFGGWMGLEIEGVPYQCTQDDARTLILHNAYYAGKLVVKSRFIEKYAGFNCGAS